MNERNRAYAMRYFAYSDDAEAKQKEADIVESLAEDGLFEDADFQASASSLYKDGNRPPLGYLPSEVVDWSRINQLEVRGMMSPCTFGDDIGQLRQGSMSDCYFLSALAMLSTNKPELLKSLIVSDDNRYVRGGPQSRRSNAGG